MKSIILVTTSFPERCEGESAAGSFVYDLALSLSKSGVATHVVAPGLGSHSNRVGKNLEVHYFCVPRLPLSLLSPRNISDLIPILKTVSAGKKAVHSVVQEHKPDHILALWALPSGYWAQQASQKFGVPYSVWCLGSDIWSLGKVPLVKTVLKNVINHAHLRFADGLRLAEDVERLIKKKVDFLPTTRSLTSSKKSALREAPPYRFLFLGRWHMNKGIDLLLDSLLSLSENTWRNIECVRIYGGGPLESLIIDKADELKSRGLPVHLGGYLAKNEAEDAIINSDYVIIPSRIESIPVILSDSLKLGVPVVATPVGDIPELLMHDPCCGLLAKEASVEGIRAALEVAVNRSPASFSEGVVQVGARFDFDMVVDTVAELVRISKRDR